MADFSFGMRGFGRVNNNLRFAQRCCICRSTAGRTYNYAEQLNRIGFIERDGDNAHPRCFIARQYEAAREKK